MKYRGMGMGEIGRAGRKVGRGKSRREKSEQRGTKYNGREG